MDTQKRVYFKQPIQTCAVVERRPVRHTAMANLRAHSTTTTPTTYWASYRARWTSSRRGTTPSRAARHRPSSRPRLAPAALARALRQRLFSTAAAPPASPCSSASRPAGARRPPSKRARTRAAWRRHPATSRSGALQSTASRPTSTP